MLYKNAVEPGTLELLESLQGNSFFEDFHLAGGTSLALQIGHRKSIDLDLFTLNDFDSNATLEYLEKSFGFKSIYSSTNTLRGLIKDTKVDLIAHKYPFVYPILNIEKIRLFSLQDIAAMKLNSIAGNGTRSKDFIDIFYLLKVFSVEEILSYYEVKYKSRNQMHVLKSLIYFGDIDMDDWPRMIIEKELSLDTIKTFLMKEVNEYLETTMK